MQRDQGVAIRQSIGRAGVGGGEQAHQRIDHDIADAMNFLRRDAFASQVLVGVFRGREEKIRQTVGDDAIHFLGHSAVEGAQAGFDVGELDRQFGADQGGGDGGVDVPVNENDVGLAIEQNGLEAGHNVGGLAGMGSGADAEIDVGRGDFELREEDVGEIFVVVLAGVNQGLAHAGAGAQGMEDGRGFHEIGARADYVQDVHDWGFRLTVLCKGVIDPSTPLRRKSPLLAQRTREKWGTRQRR